MGISFFCFVTTRNHSFVNPCHLTKGSSFLCPPVSCSSQVVASVLICSQEEGKHLPSCCIKDWTVGRWNKRHWCSLLPTYNENLTCNILSNVFVVLFWLQIMLLWSNLLVMFGKKKNIEAKRVSFSTTTVNQIGVSTDHGCSCIDL